MKLIFALVTCTALSAPGQDWRVATPGWQYRFPVDHHPHREFKTEWWYFTGNVFDTEGRRFGFELTFFREGITAPAQRRPDQSRFIVNDLMFAHFAVTDVAGAQFLYNEKASRGAFGEAGFDRNDQIAWLDDWSLNLNHGGEFRLAAVMTDAAVDLNLLPQKQPVIHGVNGISTKASGGKHASHYYSITRLDTAGTIRIRDKKFRVTGVSWFDHEWATNQLAPNQAGWNWLCLQLSDGTDLMLYQMRLTDGTADPASSGTLVTSDGSTKHLTSAEFTAVPSRWWQSRKTSADYPVEWKVSVPILKLDLALQPVLREQELALKPLVYWEGAIEAAGKVGNRKLSGVGYLELTGYAGPLRELAR